MLLQRFGGAERDGEFEDLQVIEEGEGFLLPAVEIEGNERTRPRGLLPVDGIFGIVGGQQPEVANLANLGLDDEKRRDLLGIALLLLSARCCAMAASKVSLLARAPPLTTSE